ncbi:hypothetical protein ANN_15500 [Periplaneta americana]|uniref:Uncharacterized protein n=1 Tax=Periplaneta americana TaxID=6978 RepID=A0ABQ8SGJ3_PERAM|nr:hypothetical protein ANN_15500 [Periplaneta americana]
MMKNTKKCKGMEEDKDREKELEATEERRTLRSRGGCILVELCGTTPHLHSCVLLFSERSARSTVNEVSKQTKGRRLTISALIEEFGDEYFMEKEENIFCNVCNIEIKINKRRFIEKHCNTKTHVTRVKELCTKHGNVPSTSDFPANRSLYRRCPEAADSLDRPPWMLVVQRCWMASAMAPEADLLEGGVSPRTDGGLGEFAEAGMVTLSGVLNSTHSRHFLSPSTSFFPYHSGYLSWPSDHVCGGPSILLTLSAGLHGYLKDGYLVTQQRNPRPCRREGWPTPQTVGQAGRVAYTSDRLRGECGGGCCGGMVHGLSEITGLVVRVLGLSMAATSVSKEIPTSSTTVNTDNSTSSIAISEWLDESSKASENEPGIR